MSAVVAAVAAAVAAAAAARVALGCSNMQILAALSVPLQQQPLVSLGCSNVQALAGMAVPLMGRQAAMHPPNCCCFSLQRMSHCRWGLAVLQSVLQLQDPTRFPDDVLENMLKELATYREFE